MYSLLFQCNESLSLKNNNILIPSQVTIQRRKNAPPPPQPICYSYNFFCSQLKANVFNTLYTRKNTPFTCIKRVLHVLWRVLFTGSCMNTKVELELKILSGKGSSIKYVRTEGGGEEGSRPMRTHCVHGGGGSELLRTYAFLKIFSKCIYIW